MYSKLTSLGDLNAGFSYLKEFHLICILYCCFEFFLLHKVKLFQLFVLNTLLFFFPLKMYWHLGKRFWNKLGKQLSACVSHSPVMLGYHLSFHVILLSLRLGFSLSAHNHLSSSFRKYLICLLLADSRNTSLLYNMKSFHEFLQSKILKYTKEWDKILYF